jgi:hypothetical protein
MSAKLREVLQVWLPAEVGRTLELAARDPEVRSLCDDLVMAVEALERWSRMTGREAAERAEEYRELADGLAAELATEIRRAAGSSRSP